MRAKLIYYPPMISQIGLVKHGTVTTPQGFMAGAVKAGVKYEGRLDLGVLCSEEPCVTAGLFTSNKIKSAPVLYSRKQLEGGRARGVVVNSGCANACTGEQGMTNAGEMAALAGRALGVAPRAMLVASTGVIGVQLPMDRIAAALPGIRLSRDGGHDLVAAMMTTDTFSKEIAVRASTPRGDFTVGGVAKGAGMIHPDLATMLCFVATDAAVTQRVLRAALKKAAGDSFNMVSVDGDTSPSDTVLLFANGRSGVALDRDSVPVFEQALTDVCVYLAKCIARDGEGATRLIEIVVEGALTEAQARRAARTISTSPLVKTAVHGADPNWGRIVAAVGRSGVEVVESRLAVDLNGIPVMRSGAPLPFDKAQASNSLKQKEVAIRVGLGLGPGRGTAWGCDLSKEYVSINADYTT